MSDNHKDIEKMASKMITDATKIEFTMNDLIPDETKSTIELKPQGGITIKVALKKLGFKTRIKTKVEIINIDEEISGSIENTYLAFDGDFDTTKNIVNFTKINAYLAPDFLSQVDLQFSGILANMAFKIARGLVGNWIQKTFIDTLATEHKNSINEGIAKAILAGIPLDLFGVKFTLTINLVRPITSAPDQLQIMFDGTLDVTKPKNVLAENFDRIKLGFLDLTNYFFSVKDRFVDYFYDSWNTKRKFKPYAKKQALTDKKETLKSDKPHLDEEEKTLASISATKGRINEWGNLLIDVFSPGKVLGNNIIPTDFVSFTADNFSNMATMEYNPNVEVNFWAKGIQGKPSLKINPKDDCVGGNVGTCFTLNMRIGLDNPGNDSCETEVYLNINDIGHTIKRPFLVINNYDFRIVDKTCTEGINVYDMESFIRNV